MEVARLKTHEASNRCFCIVVGTNTAFGTMMMVKIIIKDLIVIRRGSLRQMSFRKQIR